MFRVVVLPAPFGPMRPRISLGYASRERPWRAGWPSYDFQSCCNSIAGKGMRIVHETRPRDLKGWMDCRDQASRGRSRTAATRGGWASHDFLSQEGPEAPRFRGHAFAIVEHDGLGEVFAPAVLIVNRTPELGLRLPRGRHAAPVLRSAEDVLRLREGDKREIEPPRLAVEARQVQERPAAALEVRAVVFPVKPLEGVEQERLRALRIVAVRGEDAGREEGLAEETWLAGRLRLVQSRIEGRARVVPTAELHQCVPLSQEGECAHRRIRGCAGAFRIQVRGLRPSQGSRFLDAVMERGVRRLAIHR